MEDPNTNQGFMLEKLSVENAKLNRELAHANSSWDEVVKDFNACKEEKTANEAIYKEEIERLLAENERYMIEQCQLKSQLASADYKLRLAEMDIDTLNNQYRMLEEKSHNLKNSNDRYVTDIASLQSNISISHDELEKLRQENKDLTEKSKSFDNKMSLKADIESIKQNLQRKQPNSLIQLKQHINEYFEQTNQLSKEFRQKQIECDELKLEYQEGFTAYEKKLQEQQDLLKRLTDALKFSRLTNEGLIKKVKSLSSDKEDALARLLQVETDFSSDKQKFEAQIKSANEQIISLQNKIDNLSNKTLSKEQKDHENYAEQIEANFIELEQRLQESERQKTEMESHNINLLIAIDKLEDYYSGSQALKMETCEDESDLQQLVKDYKQKIVDLESRNSFLQKQIKTASELPTEDIKMEIVENPKFNPTDSKKTGEADKIIKNLQKEKQETTGKLKKVLSDNMTFKAQKEAAMRQYEEISNLMKSKSQQLDSLAKKLRELEENGAQGVKISELQSSLDSVMTQNNQLEDERNKWKQVAENRLIANTHLKKKLFSLQGRFL